MAIGFATTDSNHTSHIVCMFLTLRMQMSHKYIFEIDVFVELSCLGLACVLDRFWENSTCKILVIDFRGYLVPFRPCIS